MSLIPFGRVPVLASLGSAAGGFCGSLGEPQGVAIGRFLESLNVGFREH